MAGPQGIQHGHVHPRGRAHGVVAHAESHSSSRPATGDVSMRAFMAGHLEFGMGSLRPATRGILYEGFGLGKYVRTWPGTWRQAGHMAGSRRTLVAGHTNGVGWAHTLAQQHGPCTRAIAAGCLWLVWDAGPRGHSTRPAPPSTDFCKLCMDFHAFYLLLCSNHPMFL